MFIFVPMTNEQKRKAAIELYDPRLHDVNCKRKREDKQVVIKKYTGGKDDAGRLKYIEDKSIVEVSRISLDFVKYGIEQKAVFAVGAGVNLIPSDNNTAAFEYIERNWNDSKIENDLVEFFRTCKAETEVAFIWHAKDDFKDKGFRYTIVSPSRGDRLEPIFDDYKDMIGFKRTFQFSDDTVTDYYKKEGERVYIERLKGDEIVEVFELPYVNLPIIYYSQNEGEFAKSKVILDALERIISDADESGKYFANPLLMVKGENIALPQQQQQGKTIFGTGADTDAKFIMPDNATEQNRFLWETLNSQLFMQNRVAPLSFQELKNISGLSGVTIERMLTDCYIEASLNQKGEFGKAVQRCVNWLTKEWLNIIGGDKNFRVNVEFNDYTLQDESELIATRMAANGGQAVEDLETSLRKLGVKDIDDRMNKLNPSK